MNNRKIKFRVWSKKSNCLEYSDEFAEFYEFFEQAAQDEEKCQQFTGFVDKNDKDIYEGDILRAYTMFPRGNDIKNPCEVEGVVEWHEEIGQWEFNYAFGGLETSLTLNALYGKEVIGNILE